MALRSFTAFDSDALTVASDSPSLTPGTNIINESNTPDGTIFQFNGGFSETVTLDDRSDDDADDDATDSVDVFEDDALSDHVISDGAGLVANGTEVQSESQMTLRQLDADGDPFGPNITIYVFSTSVTSDVWGFSSDTALIAGAKYEKITGTIAGASTYNDFVMCFGPGTLIRTPIGQIAIEDLRLGDLIWTQDNPACRLEWIGRRDVAALGAFAPVVFAPHAMGNHKPLTVSPEHRMIASGADVEMLFGTDDVLVAAKHLVGLPGVTRRSGGTITYTHLMFDTHRVVEADGCLSESFFPSDLSISALDDDARKELFQLFPELASTTFPARFAQTVAPVLRAYEAKLLCATRMQDLRLAA